MSIGVVELQRGVCVMSFKGYIWGGLIRVGYDRKDTGKFIALNKLQAKGKATVREVVRMTKPEIRKAVKQRYTYKGAISIRSKVSGMGGAVIVKGKRNTLTKFQTRGGRGRAGRGEKLYASVIRGQGGIIERAFKGKTGRIWRRDTPKPLPIHMLYGPSTAEMSGKEPIPAKYIIEQIESKLESAMGAMI